MAVWISSGIACVIQLGNKVIQKIIIKKYNKYNKQYQKDQQRIKAFAKLNRKSYQDNSNDKTEHEPLCNMFTNYRWNKDIPFLKKYILK